MYQTLQDIHLLKLVTGVEISTRAVNRSGRPGNEVKSRSRTAAAALKMTAFLLSILMLISIERQNEAQLCRDHQNRSLLSKVCPRDVGSKITADGEAFGAKPKDSAVGGGKKVQVF